MMSFTNQLKVIKEQNREVPAELIAQLYQFEKDVSYMRKLQKRYFKTRKPDVLVASKDIEKKVDDHLDHMGLNDQQTLF